MELENQLKINAIQGANIVRETLEGTRPFTDLAKLASSSITQHIKYLATKGATSAVKYAAMRDISKNKKELKDMIKNYGNEILPIK